MGHFAALINLGFACARRSLIVVGGGGVGLFSIRRARTSPDRPKFRPAFRPHFRPASIIGHGHVCPSV